MKRSTKIAASLLAGLTLSASLAASASALYYTDSAVIWKNTPTALTQTDDYIFYDGSWYRRVETPTYSAKSTGKELNSRSVAETKTIYSTNPFKSSGSYENDGIYSANAEIVKNGKAMTGTSSYGNTGSGWFNGTSGYTGAWSNGCTIRGGTYYTGTQAKNDLQKYFDSNCCGWTMHVGEEKGFCAGAQLFSNNPGVVYYNEKTGKLVAKDYGNAEVYVYTSGAIPFYRINVSVANPFNTLKAADTLNVTPDSWQLSVGETTYFSVTSASGRAYDDIVFEISQGKGAIGEKNGKFTAEANGPVVVAAYSKSNRNVRGEALLYVGSRFAAIPSGGWSVCGDGITVQDWSFDYSQPWCIDGWVKGYDGLFIPVIKKIDVVYTDYDGKKVASSALTGGAVTYTDLLREAYGDKSSVRDVLDRYNLFRYGKSSTQMAPTVLDANDYRNLLFARIIGSFHD